MNDLDLAVRESNAIEGVPNEGLWLSNHIRAARFCQMAAEEQIILPPRLLHAFVFEGLVEHLPGDHEPGEYRRCGVRVGDYIAPPPEQVNDLMSLWNAEAPAMEPWDAHAWFEEIHPFPDGNGRVGRLLWWNLSMLRGEPIEIIFAGERHAYYKRLETWREREIARMGGGKG